MNTLKQKNLLIISHTYANFIKDQVECLAPYFNRVDVLVRYALVTRLYRVFPLNGLKPFLKETIFDLSDLPDNVNVHSIPLFYLPLNVFYKRLGIQHYNAVAKYINKHSIKFDLVHAHIAWSAGFAGVKVSQDFGVPLILTAHGSDIVHLPFRSPDWKKRIQDVLNSADHVITVSKNNLNKLKELEITKPVSLIPNGFRRKYFNLKDPGNCREKLGLPLDRKIILSVGHLVPEKGHKYLLSAVHTVLQRRNDVICVIIGDGPLKKSLEDQSKQLGIENFVSILDSRPHDEINLWMNACDIFALPSLREGLPVVNIEAMACGKPVVATKNGGSEDLIVDDTLGYLVEPGNSQHLSEKLLCALEQPWDAKKITHFIEAYQWENIASQIATVYKGLL